MPAKDPDATINGPSAHRVFVGGYSCRLPKSDSPAAAWDNLVSGVDMVGESDARWPAGTLGLPTRIGVVSAIDRFDAAFFEVHAKQAHRMDPQLRLLLEVAYEAILDAGINPADLKGTRTGVYVGAHAGDSQANFGEDPSRVTGYENSGCSLSMFANRLSFLFDLRGPSETIDTACSSSAVAFDAATQAIAAGRCDYAIVGGTNIMLRPSVSLGFDRLRMLSPDGVCRTFDRGANGYVRAETVAAIVLVRGDLASGRRRAEVLATGVNSDGYTHEGITFPSRSAQTELLRDVYARAQVDPREVAYIEAHGTGTPAGDPQELAALDSALGQGRSAENPILVGSVKSNMGHAEGAAAMAGLVKILLAMEKGIIPPNLHFNDPNPDLAGILEGRFRVVDSPTKWQGGVVGLNSFGFGGTNAHLVLRSVPPVQDNAEPDSPALFPVCSRSAAGLDAAKLQIQQDKGKAGVAAYLSRIANQSLRKKPFRACLLADASNAQLVDGQHETGERPPVWWICSGMGSQWPTMGRGLLATPLTATSLSDSADVARDLGLDLVDVLSRADDDVFSGPLHSFVGITAIQIALVDALTALGVAADGLIGHSVGEIACAYADGAIDRSQAIRIAYWRGKALQDTPAVAGGMLAVDATLERAESFAHDGVVVACHNSNESVTLSGALQHIERCAAELEAAGLGFKQVDSSGVAFHSPRLDPALPAFRRALAEVLPHPRARSERWISTSQAVDSTAAACDVDFFMGNLREPVRFHEACVQVPEGAIVLELGPHTILRRVLADSCPGSTQVGLTRRGFAGEREFLLGLARLYVAGVDLDWTKLAPPGAATPTSPTWPLLADWDHTQDWEVADHYRCNAASRRGDRTFSIDLQDDEFGFMGDHMLNERPVFPGVGYLWLVWRTLAERAGVDVDSFPLEFTDVSFLRATTLDPHKSVDLTVRILPATHGFEVAEGEHLVAKGQVVGAASAVAWEQLDLDVAPVDEREVLDAAGLYKELRLRGYDYGPSFKQIEAVSMDGCQVRVRWDGNWVTFLDSLLQSGIVRYHRQTVLPTFIRRLAVDPRRQPNDEVLSVRGELHLNQLCSDAVLMEGADFTVVPQQPDRSRAEQLVCEFTPYVQRDMLRESGADEVVGYIENTRRFMAQQARATLALLKQTHGSLPAHLTRLERVVAKMPDRDPDPAQLERFFEHPRAIILRLARSMFSDPHLLYGSAIQAIAGHPEYHKLYSDDLGFSILLGDPLRDLYFTVEENQPPGQPLRICELGAGTGGLTAHLLPLTLSEQDRYLLTDVSAGFFEQLRQRFSGFDGITDYATWDINQPLPASTPGEFDMIAASNALHAGTNVRQTLQHIHGALRDDGFLLLHETTHGADTILSLWGFLAELWRFDDAESRSSGAFLDGDAWREMLDAAGFDVVSEKDDGCLLTMFLCRKRATRSRAHTVLRFEEDAPEPFAALQQRLQRTDDDSRLWVMGNDQSGAGLLGMLNCLRKEPGGDRLRLALQQGEGQTSDDVLARVSRPDLYQNVFRGAVWGSYRHHQRPPAEPLLTEDARMSLATRGDLSTLGWQQAPVCQLDDHSCEARYAGLNFKDLMLASGRLPPSADEGRAAVEFVGEFSGVLRNGRRVMGSLNRSLPLRFPIPGLDLSRTDEQLSPFIWDVPDDWTLEQAATVPVAYATAYLALAVRGQLCAGERVLIHSGTGGVGQAAIRIALAYGCEVFTTVGGPEKRAFVARTFPQIPSDHVGNSRDTTFERAIMNATGGAGVDIVLNSLSDDKLQAGVRVLGRYGRFIEIGRYDMTRNTPLGMAFLRKDCQLHGVGLDSIRHDHPAQLQRVWRLVNEGVASGVVQPLPTTLFRHDELEQAFRYMGQGTHIGKVVVRLGAEAEHPDRSPAVTVAARRRFWCHPDKSYLIAGGLGGFGLELADWLVQRGARKLVLTSRSGVKTAYQRFRLRDFAKRGAAVEVSQRDVGQLADAEALIADIERTSRLGGIFQLAMVLKDALFVNLPFADFQQVLHNKLEGARNLDQVSRRHCDQLDCFVAFSSLAAAYGNPGQSAYGYANAGLDRLCERRRSEGLPGLSVQWGEIGDVGFVAEHRDQVNIKALRSRTQSLASCLETLEQLLCERAPVVASYVAAQHNFGTADAAAGEANVVRDYAQLVRDVKGILGLPADATLPTTTSLLQMGMDSLMSVELAQKLERDYEIRIPGAGLPDLTLADLQTHFDGGPAAGGLPPETATKPGSAGPFRFIDRTELPLFDTFGEPELGPRVTYFLTGFGADPFEPLRLVAPPAGTTVVAVRYEQAANMRDLADKWVAHLLGLPTTVTSVRVVGYSTGAIIAHRLMALQVLQRARPDLSSVTISPPNTSIYDPLETLALESLDGIPMEEGMSRLSQLSTWGDYDLIPYDDIKKQIRLLVQDAPHKAPLGPVGTVVLPTNDANCWSEEHAERLSGEVVVVPGIHDVRQIGLNRWL